MKHIAENVKDVFLKDDETSTGGVSHANETVGDFCADEDIDLHTSIDDLNNTLKECGIKPVSRFDIRRTYVNCAKDILASLKEHTEYVQYGQNVDCPAIVEDIRTKYPDDVISDVLANDVIGVMQYDRISKEPVPSIQAINRYTDGRYSNQVKEWAFERVTSENFDYDEIPHSETIIHDRSHPVIVNSLISEYMKAVEQDKAVDKPKSPKSIERE